MYLPFAANKNNKKRPSIELSTINLQYLQQVETILQSYKYCRLVDRDSCALQRLWYDVWLSLTFHLSVKVTREQQSLSYSRHYPYTYLGIICLYRYFPFDPQKRIYQCRYRYLDTYYNNILPILSWYFFVFLLASFRWF